MLALLNDRGSAAIVHLWNLQK